MNALTVIGIIALCLFGFSMIIGGLLNLGGCGDRVGEKYRIANSIQIIFGFFILCLCWYLS